MKQEYANKLEVALMDAIMGALAEPDIEKAQAKANVAITVATAVQGLMDISDMKDDLGEGEPNIEDPETTMLTPEEVADRYEVSTATIWRWRKINPGFPEPVKLGLRKIMWRLSDLMAFEEVKRND